MNRSIRVVLLAAGVLAASFAVSAQDNQIYTWTDENGVVHYVDTPPDNPNAVSMDAPEAYRPGTADAYPDEEPAAAEDAQDLSGDQLPGADSSEGEEKSYADQRREEIARKHEERRAEEEQRTQNCARARLQLQTLEPSRRVYFTNDQGETERMDDEKRVRMVEDAKAAVAKYCD